MSTILVIHPPLVSPASPPFFPVVGPEIQTFEKVCFYDANLDFFTRYLLNPDHLSRIASAVLSQDNNCQRSDKIAPLIQEKLPDLHSHLDTLRSDGFFDPALCARALAHVDALLEGMSQVYAPARITRYGIQYPGIAHWDQARKVAVPGPHNPFSPICMRELTRLLDRHQPQQVLFFIHDTSQMLGILTMEHYIRTYDPHVRVVIAANMKSSDLPWKPFSDMQLLTEAEIVWTSQESNSQNGYLAPASVHYVPKNSLLKDLPFLRNQQAYLATAAGTCEGHDPMCITWHLDANTDPPQFENFSQARARGVRLIQWLPGNVNLQDLVPVWRNASKAGIWNHVILTGHHDSDILAFITANPNITHSFCVTAPLTAPWETVATETKAYARARPLPGQPFWERLHDPVYLLLYLQRYDPVSLARWRVMDPGHSVKTLGQQITWKFVPPNELSPEEMDEIERMVMAGGSVGRKWLRHNLQHAYLIAIAMELGVIIGNSSLKHPRQEYIEKVGQRIGMDLSSFLERGYTSVRPEYRGMGIGTRLLEGLTQRAEGRKIFSIISEDNLATQQIAKRVGTQKITTFFSEVLGKEVGVWMPASTIEKLRQEGSFPGGNP